MLSLSVVLPARNEEATIESVIEEVLAVVQELRLEYEIILVNDGSTDRTGEIGRTLVRRVPNLRLIEHFPGRHYGGALKAGFAAATKELIAFFPADKQFVFSEIDRLLAKLTEAEIVSGYRSHRQDNLIRRFNCFGWNTAVRILFGHLCRDIDCGFKVFRREILERVKLVSDGAPIDTELLAGAKARSYRIAEVEVTHLPRIAGKATGADFKVIARAFRDLPRFKLRLNQELYVERQARATIRKVA
ncbi:MAG: glycosyltransferase family 2 protein [Syntrophobacteraceae bacterium]